ncbi:hypothetical protein EXU57_21005 [Segetibacter sp. 3557_3]|uniref:sensor histidine kinase n=1 Tax=Segetibacter sp. 3557_3 TaxID=2547429 RepID=UPI001058CBF0|nr:ATP-binding protein [Segetibacter sp. 3557_3]TDH20874.1 hypothetical protein EXU57_21005 [Segetibacter sp. 3557_3]
MKNQVFYLYIRYAAYAVLAIAIAVLIGWLVNISFLKSIHPRLVPMNPLTATGFICVACWLLMRQSAARIPKFLFTLLAFYLLFVGTFKVLNMYFGFNQSTPLINANFSAKMSPAASVNFALLGISMLVSGSSSRHKNNLILAPLFTIFMLSFITLFGYSIGNNDILTMRPFPLMALHTTFCFMLVTLCMLFLHADNALLRPFTSNDLGGYSSRKLLPYVILVPFSLGFLRFHGERLGLYNTGFGVSIQVFISTVIFLLLIWREAVVLNNIDKKRKQAEKKMSEYSNEMEQFAFIASHDLREPLRKISTFANMIQSSGQLENKGKDHIDKIVATSKRMQTFITDLLDFTKLVHHEEQVEKISLTELVDNIKADYELMIIEKNAVVKADNLPEVEGVRFQLNQLFYNLIGNALKFSKPGIQAHITITCEQVSKAEKLLYNGLPNSENYYHIVVRDNGIGFEQAQASRIFEMFQRLYGKNAYPGSGIGLAICKKIVANHHGDIYAESEPTIGSTFHIIFPERQPEGSRAAERPEPLSLQTSTAK